MKFFWIIALAFVHSATANESDLDFCSQQLIHASSTCLGVSDLESCIANALEKGGCEVEILANEDINICNDTCSPNITTDVINESKENILSLTEGE